MAGSKVRTRKPTQGRRPGYTSKTVTPAKTKSGRKVGVHKFVPGNPGRPRGAKNKIPTSVKASIKALLEKVSGEDADAIERAIKRGIRSSPKTAIMYLRMAAEYVDGKPTDHVNLTGDLVLQEQLNNAGAELQRRLATLTATAAADGFSRDAESDGQAVAPEDVEAVGTSGAGGTS